MRILVVDDLPFMRTLIKNSLKEAGFQVAGEASHGLECLRQYRMLKPDLVLLDIVMPVMDGVKTLRRLRIFDPGCRVIMCSSLSDEKMIMQAIRYGAIDYIVKPFAPERLVAAIKKSGLRFDL